MTARHRSFLGAYLVCVGAAWAIGGAIATQGPEYWDAVTALDYAAVWTYSLALLMSAPALVILVRQAHAGRAATIVAWLMAVAAVATSMANAIEDGLHLKAFSTLYIVGAVPLFYGLLLLALLLGMGARKRFALIPLLMFVGTLANASGGGILIGATWAVFGALVLTGRTEPVSRETPPPPSVSVEAA